MKKYAYEITDYPADAFKQLVYFCSDQGECSLRDVSSGQMEALRDVLNERGSQGWELVQLFFGSDGVVGIWKREI
jgi:hypothetical protein